MKRCFFDFDPIPLHVVNKCPYPKWPIRDQRMAWKIFCNIIESFHYEYGIRTHAFVMMSNHYHWLCSTQKKDLDLQAVFNWFDHMVGMELYLHDYFVDPEPNTNSGFDLFDHYPEIFEQEHIQAYKNTYAYIYRNPVAAGIVEKAEDYPYSTLHYILGKTKKKLPFYCHDDMNVISDTRRVLGFIHEVGLT
jgi:putative transposase